MASIRARLERRRGSRLTSPSYVGMDDRSLIAPVEFGILFLGPFLDLRVGLVEPLLHGDGRLLIGTTDGLLRGESPTLAHGAVAQPKITGNLAAVLERNQSPSILMNFVEGLRSLVLTST